MISSPHPAVVPWLNWSMTVRKAPVSGRAPDSSVARIAGAARRSAARRSAPTSEALAKLVGVRLPAARSSAATLALTSALFTAFRPPETSSVRPSGTVRATTTSASGRSGSGMPPGKYQRPGRALPEPGGKQR